MFIKVLFKGGTQRVGGFGLLQAYDNEVPDANDENRCTAGSNADLKYNNDGSLDIYLSHNKPKGDSSIQLDSNPEERFKILF